MKILIIDDCVDLVGGVERTICTLANRLVENNDVEILNINNLVPSSFYKYDERIKKTYLFNQIHYKSQKYNKKSIKHYYYKAIEKIQHKLGKKVFIKKKINSYKGVDVIIFGRVFVALNFLPYMKNFNAKVIVRDAIHLEFFNKKIKLKMKKYFPNLVSTFIVSSDESIKAYRKFFESDKVNIVKIYNPIGIKPVKGFDFNNKTVISIGRMDDNQKGFDNLIKAFAIVHMKHKDWKLKIYGDGQQKEELRELVASLNAKSYIKLEPSTKDVEKVFNSSSIFVLASRYEGYANILVEALSCGIPSISYNWLMGTDEIIKDGNNGLIVKLYDRYKYFEGECIEEDCKNLSKAIEYLIENEDKAKEFSNESVKIVEERKQDLIISKWIDLIEGGKQENENT